MKLIYAGIGSRETPNDVLNLMTGIAEDLAPNWVLRSGYAGGADMAFYRGAHNHSGAMEMYIPWHGFNQGFGPNFICPPMTQELVDLAAKYHPAWDRCKDGAKKLHARNGCQILGLGLKTPATMVICWTPGGLGGGGTGQAIRIAKDHGIPVFDLEKPNALDQLIEFTDRIERT